MLVSENIGKRSIVLLLANKRLNRMNKSQILSDSGLYFGHVAQGNYSVGEKNRVVVDLPKKIG